MAGAETLVEGRSLRLTNLEKIYWPEGYTKAHLLKYYRDIAPVIIPHLRGRPLVMKRYPDGISGQSFYQKECPASAPEWIRTSPVRHSGKVVNYIVCDDGATLVWLASQGCIEVHAWLSRVEDVEMPDIGVMDLDPEPQAPFEDVLEVALLVRRVLDEYGVTPFAKTSGAAGLHVFVPVKAGYTYAQVTRAFRYVAEVIASVYPEKTTVERTVARRRGRIYLDYLQNGRGKTMAFQYSLRPFPGAPVSTPLKWSELEEKKIRPADYNIRTIFNRLDQEGDLMQEMYAKSSSLDRLLESAGTLNN